MLISNGCRNQTHSWKLENRGCEGLNLLNFGLINELALQKNSLAKKLFQNLHVFLLQDHNKIATIFEKANTQNSLKELR
jgi:hypothetical protein